MPFQIFYSPEFKRDYKKLPKNLREQLKIRGLLFEINPFHPRLRTHKLSGKLKGVWSFSVDIHYRVIFEFLGDQEILLLRVGDHGVYKKVGGV